MKTRKEVMDYVRKGGLFLKNPKKNDYDNIEYLVDYGQLTIYKKNLKGCASFYPYFLGDKLNLFNDSAYEKFRFRIGVGKNDNSSYENIAENKQYSIKEIKEIFEKYYYNLLLNNLKD